MYRILRAAGQTGERRAQATHPARTKPELVADAPNQVWSWDITRLRGPVKGVWFHLYTVIDIWSRYVVGHLIAAYEDGQLAEALIADAAARERVNPDQLTVHADRGAAMTSKTVTQLLTDLKIGRSHSRPKTSNDNPYIEASFKTLKYDPMFPERFGSIQHARQHCEAFYTYYNHEHRHSGIGLHTPASVHHGTAGQIRETAATHPRRRLGRPPRTVRPAPAATASPPGPGMDQQTRRQRPRTGHHRGGGEPSDSTTLNKIKKLSQLT